jgi:hypothetical protein
VNSYDEDTYTCKAEDMSFAALSKRFYHSPDYAQALLRYNREHPLRSEEFGGPAPQLRPGTQVRIPAVALLETRYPEAIPNLKPLPEAAPRPAVSSVGQSSPVSQAERPPPVIATTPSAPQPAVPVTTAPPGGGVVPVRAPASGKVYVVPAGGQMFAEVAQSVYGTPGRWNEIWQVNQHINDPAQRLPEGTQLRLPPSAPGQP